MSNGPEDFVDFADWLGLNDEAGQQMLNRSMSGGDKQLADVAGAQENQRNAARRIGTEEGQQSYDQYGAAASKGLASYAEFMHGMSDPAARQALMEKTYGRGAVSKFDSALAGGGGRAGQIADTAKQAQTTFAANETRNDARRGLFQKRADESKAAAEWQRNEDTRLAQARADQFKKQQDDTENARIDAFGRATADKEGGAYEADKMTWTGNVDYGGIFGMPNKNINTGNIKSRDWAKAALAKYEATSGNKYKAGGDI